MIVFAHSGLPSARAKEEFRAYWKSTLESLIELAKEKGIVKTPRRISSARK